MRTPWKTSCGVFHPRASRGRWLSSLTTTSSCSGLVRARSVQQFVVQRAERETVVQIVRAAVREPPNVGCVDADGITTELPIKTAEGALPVPGSEDGHRPVAGSTPPCGSWGGARRVRIEAHGQQEVRNHARGKFVFGEAAGQSRDVTGRSARRNPVPRRRRLGGE